MRFATSFPVVEAISPTDLPARAQGLRPPATADTFSCHSLARNRAWRVQHSETQQQRPRRRKMKALKKIARIVGIGAMAAQLGACGGPLQSGELCADELGPDAPVGQRRSALGNPYTITVSLHDST